MIVEFSRRKFLLAAGGSALALPVLEALTPRSAHAAFDTVKRMVFFVTVNGSPRGNRPTGVGPSFELGPIFSGLERHKADTLFITGLGSRAAEISNGDPHALGFATTLSGCKALPGDLFRHGACFDQPTCQGTGWGGGPSVDQLIAQAHIAAGVPIIESSLNFAVKNAPGSLYTRLSYSAPGTPLTPEASPSDAFDRIFGGVKSTDPAVLARIRARQASVLDELDAELVSLQTRLSAADRLRLDAHLTGLRSLEAKIARMEGQSGGECGPPTRSPLGAGTLVKRNDGGMEEDVQEHMMDSIIERHDIWQEMTMRALACDLTRVVTIITAPSRADTFMPWLEGKGLPGNFTKPHHAASHDNDVPTLTSMDNWYSQRVASYVDDLKAEMDVDGKPLFERSALCYFNELGDGADHSHHDKPHVIIGSLGGFFKQGQLVKYPDATPHNVLLTAIAQSMGVETDHVGTTEPELMGGDVSLVKA